MFVGRGSSFSRTETSLPKLCRGTLDHFGCEIRWCTGSVLEAARGKLRVAPQGPVGLVEGAGARPGRGLGRETGGHCSVPASGSGCFLRWHWHAGHRNFKLLLLSRSAVHGLPELQVAQAASGPRATGSLAGFKFGAT